MWTKPLPFYYYSSARQKVDRIIRRWINLINETLSKWTRVSEIDGTSPSAPGAFAFEDITNQIINTELLLTRRGKHAAAESTACNHWFQINGADRGFLPHLRFPFDFSRTRNIRRTEGGSTFLVSPIKRHLLTRTFLDQFFFLLFFFSNSNRDTDRCQIDGKLTDSKVRIVSDEAWFCGGNFERTDP